MKVSLLVLSWVFVTLLSFWAYAEDRTRTFYMENMILLVELDPRSILTYFCRLSVGLGENGLYLLQSTGERAWKKKEQRERKVNLQLDNKGREENRYEHEFFHLKTNPASCDSLSHVDCALSLSRVALACPLLVSIERHMNTCPQKSLGFSRHTKTTLRRNVSATFQ